MTRIALAAAAIWLGATAAPAMSKDLTAYTGTWATSPAFCAGPVAAIDAPIRIEPGRITFYEWSCVVADAADLALDAASVATLDCDGEGHQWRETIVLGLDRTGALVMLRDGAAAFFGQKCRD